jgi:prophage regulatory protein
MNYETDRIIRWPELQQILGVSRSTYWRYEKAGKAPKRVRLGPGRATGWRKSEIDKFVQELQLVD